MKNTLRNSIWVVFGFSFALLLFSPSALGQVTTGSGEKGWTSYESFGGSSDSAGVVTKLDTNIGYRFNRHFSADAGLPIYFIHASSSTSGLTSTNGIGNFYVDLRLTVDNPALNFISNLRGTAPTGDTSVGLSTGHATYDWTNHFDRQFGRFRPYGEVGIANTVSDTPYYLRLFSTFGLVGHFEAGLGFRVSRYVSLSASAYDIAASGEQTIYSRFMQRGLGSSGSGMGMGATIGVRSSPGGRGRIYETAAVTTGPASLANDNGCSSGVSFFPARFVDLGVGYSRSVHFREDSVYFGIGFDIGYLWRKSRPF